MHRILKHCKLMNLTNAELLDSKYLIVQYIIETDSMIDKSHNKDKQIPMIEKLFEMQAS